MASKFNLFYIFLLIDCSIYSSRPAPVSRKSVKKSHKNWSTEEEEKLIFFDVITDDGRGNQFQRIRKLWCNTYPYSNVTDTALYTKLYRLRHESQEGGELKKNFRWDHERKKELIHVYHNTKPYKTDAKRTLGEEWRRRHEDCQITHKSLLHKVWRVLNEKGKIPEYPEEGTSNMNLEWDRQQDSELLHAYKVACVEGEAPWKIIHRIWSNLHPQFRHVTHDQLRERVTYLKTHPPDDYFPWTVEENKELLDIYDKTMPDEEDQGQRIYDIWSRIHPRYKFMTPYYLQVHASTLDYEREMQVIEKPIKKTWMHREKKDLLNLFHRYPKERQWSREFHKEWVRKYPRSAYLSNMYLRKYAWTLEKRKYNAASRELEEGSSHREGRISGTQEKQEELHGGYDKNPLENLRHAKRMMERYEGEDDTDTPSKFRSMKDLFREGMDGKSEKRLDRAKVVYHSDGRESSPSDMSEYSE